MKNLLLLAAICLCLSSCADLALTPAPQKSNRLLVAGGDLPGDGTSSTPASDATNSTPGSTDSLTATVTLTPTVDVNSTPTIALTPGVDAPITPTVIVTATPDLNFTPIPPTATLTPTIVITPTPDLNFTPIPPTATPVPFTPIGLVADLGFRPRPNGYPFANYGTVYATDFTTIDARRMFANDAEFCFDLNSSCQDVRLQLQLFTTYANRLSQGGHCDGFTVSTLRFYQGLDRTTTFRSTAAVAYNLPMYTSVRRQIAYYWSLQLPDPVAEAQWRSSQQTPSQLLAQLRAAMTSKPADPTTLLVYNWQGQPQGHSMTPYAIDYLGHDVWHVRVYDNNWPGDLNHYVEINTGADTWSYFRGSSQQRTPINLRCGNSSALTWCGNTTSKSLSAVPISTYTQTPLCRNLCRIPAANGGPAHSLAWSDPDSNLLITDEAGQRLGVVDDQPIAEIPDAFPALLPGGLDMPATLIGHLPVNETFTYTISRPNAAALTTTAPSEISIFGPGFAAVASDITVTGTQRSQLTLTADGAQLAYHSGVTDRTGFKLVLETPDASKSVDIGGLTIGTGRTITLTFDDPHGRFIIDNTHNVTSTFDLTYTLMTGSGQRIFTATNVLIAPTDRAVVIYGPWTTNSTITPTIRSDTGTLIARFYLPLILQ
jgi:hypothetical protein